MSNEDKEKKEKDEKDVKKQEMTKLHELYLIELESKGIRIASIASIILAIVLFVLEVILQGKQNFGMYALVGTFCAVSFTYYGVRSKRVPYAITGILWAVLTVFFIIMYIMDMVNHGA